MIWLEVYLCMYSILLVIVFLLLHSVFMAKIFAPGPSVFILRNLIVV